MSVLNYLLSGGHLKKAKKLSAAAFAESNENADPLFQKAYEEFASVSNGRVQYSDSLHCWGLALYNQAQKKDDIAAIKLLEEAIVKFNLCDSVKENHLGAALDKGVALMGLANTKGLNPDDDLYVKANETFLNAEKIQQGSAAYNLACLYALQNNTDACLKALETARDCGLVPDEEAILNDSDLDNVKECSWFDEFIVSLSIVEEEPEEEPIDPYK